MGGRFFSVDWTLGEEQARSQDFLGVRSINELDPNFYYSWIGLRRSFSENQVISKKKKVFAEIRRLFLAEIRNLNGFSGQKQ